MPKKSPKRTFTVTREEFDNDEVIVSDVVVGTPTEASANPGKRVVPLSAVGELSQEALLDLNAIVANCQCADWAIAALMRVLQFVAAGKNKVDVEDRADWACHYLYQQTVEVTEKMHAFQARHGIQPFVELAVTAGMPTRPAAQLNLDTLSIKHLRCEEFMLEDRETGQVRMEIRTSDGVVSLTMWPQEEGKRFGLTLSVGDNGGLIEAQTPDGKQSASLSSHGLARVTVTEGK
jgi:hypothetical protein